MKLISLLFSLVISVVSVAQVPTITSFSPTSGPVGTTVTITGTGFSTTAADNVVYFGAVKGSVTAASNTSLTTIVPAGATYSNIYVINLQNSKQAISILPFNPTWNNSNPSTVTSSSYSLSQITTSTTPASVNSGSWNTLRHNQEVSDIDGDGKPDLIMVDNTNSKVRIIRNTSSPGSLTVSSFSSTIYDFTTIAGPLDITAGDVNNDGKIDLIISNNTTSIGVLINNSTPGTPSFITSQSITLTNSSVILKLADIDCDGRLDLLASPRGGAISCYRNSSSLPGNSISFAAAVAVGMSSMDISVGDLNLDGKIDIISSIPGGIGVCQNTNISSGTISLSTHFTLISQETYSVGVVDINNDGKLDLVGGGTWNTSGVCHQNNYSTGNLSSSSFGSNVAVSSMNSGNSQYTWNLNFGDINGDGKPEFGSGDFNSGCYVGVVTNNVATSSTIVSGSLTGTHYLSGHMGSYTNTLIVDLDLDGKADYATFSNNKIGLGRNVLTNPISASPNSLSNFSTCAGTVSSSQSTSVSGTGLSANITLTAPSEYEISLSSGTGYATSLTLAHSGGVVASTTIYVRLNSTATAGTYNANLTAVSGSSTTNIALTGIVNSTTITTQPTTTAIVKCWNEAAQALTVATSASSPTYQWQESTTSNGTYANVTTGTGGTTSSFSPLHTNISWGNTKYYRCVVTSNGCTATSNASAGYTIGDLAITSQPSTTAQTYCQGATATPITMTASANGLAITYLWNYATTPTGSYFTVVGGTGASTNTYTPPTSTAGTLYYKCYITYCGGASMWTAASGAITVNANNTVGTASSTPTLCINTALTNITHATTGVTGIGTATGLPAGVTASFASNTITISGTPTASGTFSYTIPTTGGCGSVNATGTITVNSLPTLTTNPTTTLVQHCYSNPNTTSSITVATSASSPTYQWQISNDNTSFSNVVNGTNPTGATYFPSHADILYGNTKYYRCVVTSGCGSTNSNSQPFGIYSGLTASSFPSTVDQTYCSGSSATPLTVNYATMTNWPTLNYAWTESSDLSTWSSAVGSGVNTPSFTPSTATNGTKYYKCSVSGTCGSTGAVPASGAITVMSGLTWNGTSSAAPSNSSNWTACGSGSGTDFNIPFGVPNYPEYGDLTISAGQTVTVESGARLTVNGILTNQGTLILNSGATLLQGPSSTIVGSGNYIVKQTVSGIGQFTAPSGRFWYLGSPISTASSSVFFNSLTNSATVVKKRSETTNAWVQITSAAPENLEVGRGYYAQIRPSASSANSQNVSLVFNGTINNNPTSSGLTVNLTRTANSFAGYNLVSNPYPSYLDWDLVTKNNVSNTMWYRTATGSASNTMVFETYVSGAAGGIGTNLSGNTATKLIPPMQAYWVRVNSGNTTGSITVDNSMRSHFSSFGSSTAGLRSTNDDLKMFLRMNLLQEDDKDQIIVYVNNNSSNEFDGFDGEKMMQVDRPQFYTTSSEKKIVINGLSAINTQKSLPITMELTTTGDHQFMVEDLQVESGNVWLEDKTLGTFQLLNQGFGYKFFAYEGISDDRFVLHLKLKDEPTPTFEEAIEIEENLANVYSEGAGVVVIKLPTTDDVATDVQIYDAAGRVYFTGTMKTLESKIQLEQAKGIYYVSLTSINGVEVRKVFIQ